MKEFVVQDPSGLLHTGVAAVAAQYAGTVTGPKLQRKKGRQQLQSRRMQEAPSVHTSFSGTESQSHLQGVQPAPVSQRCTLNIGAVPKPQTAAVMTMVESKPFGSQRSAFMGAAPASDRTSRKWPVTLGLEVEL